MGNVPSNIRSDTSHSSSVVADDTTVAFKTKALKSAGYVNPSTQIATTTLSLFTTADGGGTLDTSVLGGVGALDLDAADTTVGQLAANINSSDTWRMTQVASLPTDVTASSGLKLIALDEDAAEALKSVDEDGTRIYWDTTGILHVSACMGLEDFDNGGGKFGPFASRLSYNTITDNSFDISNATPFPSIQPKDRVAYITSIYVINTTAADDTITVYAVDQNDNIRTVLGPIPGPGNNANVTKSEADIGVVMGLPGERLVCRYAAPTTLTVPKMTILGGIGERI